MEEITLDEFYHDLRQDVLAASEARQDFLEAEFMRRLADELEGAGAIDGFEDCHFKALRGMRVDGYWFKEEEDVLDLFVLDFENRESLQTLTQTDVKSIFKRLENFFYNSINKKLYLDLEETSPGYGLSRDISDRQKNYSRINLYLISERNLSERIQNIDDIIFQNWTLSFHVWDMSRFFRLHTSMGAKEDLLVDFIKIFGEGLPCLPAHLKNTDYESYLLVMPGDLLAGLYGMYGSRLLEQNVRCFLQARGNVNKGIRATIINNPGMFFAFNNGVTATAKEVVTEMTDHGIIITKIRDLQIVNGGQTMASLFYTNKKDKAGLNQVFLQMKLSVVDEEKSEEVVPKISEYANTQNKVNAADFFSNHPFHVRMESFSRRLWAPPVLGSLRESKWFYERSRGQYTDAQNNLTQAGRKKFRTEYPKTSMFTKTDLAKFENVWDDKPTFVNLGAQKNFAKYAERIGKEWEKNSDSFNEYYYKRAIARAILFRHTEKIISGQSWYQGGYRANIVAYSLAQLSEFCKIKKVSIDFMQIWKSQDLSSATVSAIEIICKFVSEDIATTPEGISNISEWCKKDACWTRLKDKAHSLENILPKQFVNELLPLESVKDDVSDAKKTQKIDNGINAQARVLELTGQQWSHILEYGFEKGIFSPKEISILKVASIIPEQLPTEKQALILLDLLDKATLEGFHLI